MKAADTTTVVLFPVDFLNGMVTPAKCYNMVMLILSLFSWWYAEGWRQVATNSWRRMVRVAYLFSVPVLLRTLWAPWRRIVTYPGASIDAKIRALADNMVSRCVGFTVRLLVLITAFLMLVVVGVLGLAAIIVWPLVPLMIIGCLIKGAGA